MPQIQIIAPTAQQQPERLRVAAYARVSSDSKDQLNSYASQIRYYTNYITAHENWDFVDIYADEGITGTRADKRDDFQRMMRDCRAHKIDTILVKSVSRFARNTQDCIAAVRELRSLGVTVIFEKEHLNTSSMANEMLLSMMSAFSQEESVSISKNMHKGATMRMKNGTYKTSTPAYGYRNGFDGKLIIVPEEAEVVRYIFDRFLSGDGLEVISKSLHAMNADDPDGKTFSKNGILYILTNERYIGEQLLQKTYSNCQIPLRRIPNRGEQPQYYAAESHEPIIPHEQFLAAQKLLEQRGKHFVKQPSGSAHPLTEVLRCSHCGMALHRRSNGSDLEWICYTHLKNASSCPLKTISNNTLHRICGRLYYKLKSRDSVVLNNYLSNIKSLQEKAYNARPEVLSLNQTLTNLLEQNHLLQRLHAKGCIDSAFFISQHQALSQQIENIRQELQRYRNQTSYTTLIDTTNSLIEAISDEPAIGYIELLFPYISTMTFSSSQCEIKLVNGLLFTEKMPRKI